MVRATLSSPAVTGRSARALARVVPVPAVVTLEGELGTGKTTLVRGLLRAFGVRGAVTSPSFTLAQSYLGRGGLTLHHLDLYRLGPGVDADLFAWDDYLEAGAVVFVEWPEAGAARLPAADVALHLYHDTPRSRRLELRAAPALERACVAALGAAGAAGVIVTADGDRS